MDLKFIENTSLIILHMIDMFSKYSQASIVPSKQPETIAKHFLKQWIQIFGSPKTLFHDNGGEFVNNSIRDLCHNFNIVYTTSPAYSPWCMGVCERHNGIIELTLRKIMAETKCSYETALAWAIFAKNTLSNTSGFSPSQIAFGFNPSLPSILTDKAPALDNFSCSEVVTKNLLASQAAKKEYLQAECSEKLRRALRHKTRDHRKYFLMVKRFTLNILSLKLESDQEQ